MSACFFGLGFLCYFIALVVWVTERAGAATQHQAARQETGGARVGLPPVRAAYRRETAGVRVGPDRAGASPQASGGEMPAQFQKIKIGNRIVVKHPVRGDLTVNVDGSVLYSELMQQSRQAPWTASGNVYPGFWLEGAMFLLNWQNRLYLLDESTQLSDADIQRDFAPHAKKFAQSDQTADVYFAYPPASWKIEDIGKFRVDRVEGQGIRFRPGATGRFVHAAGDGGRGLVLEDYESGGGGEDTVWIGYKIEMDAVKA